jgi:hypothetical protein
MIKEAAASSLCSHFPFHFRFSHFSRQTCEDSDKKKSSKISDAMAENKDWKPLPPLGHYYGDDWFVHRTVEGAFSPVINRTPEQATAARRNPRPPQPRDVCSGPHEERN